MITQTLSAIRTMFQWEDPMHPLSRHTVVWMCVVTYVVGVCLSAVAAAQAPAPAPVPLQQAGATVQISEHVYVISDFQVGMVPTSQNPVDSVNLKVRPMVMRNGVTPSRPL